MNLLVADAPPPTVMAALGPAVDLVRADAVRLSRRAEAARLAPVAARTLRNYGDRDYRDGMAIILARAGDGSPPGSPIAVVQAEAGEEECEHDSGEAQCTSCNGLHPDQCDGHRTECSECEHEIECPYCGADSDCSHTYEWSCCSAEYGG